MATLSWIGGGNNLASNAKDWSPAQRPATGDTLWMGSNGTMNIKGAALAGDTLNIGGTATADDTATADTLNLRNATGLTIDQSSFAHDNITMNVTGNNSLVLSDAAFDVFGTVDIKMASNATLVMPITIDRWYFETIDVSGGTFVNNATQNLASGSSTETFDSKIIGTGTWLDNSTLTFLKPVSAGQTVDFQATSRSGNSGVLNLDDPLNFKGSIVNTGSPADPYLLNEADASINLAGLLQSTSYSFKDDILTLFDGKKIVDKLNLTTPYAVSVDKTATGISIYSGFDPNPHPQGTALPLRT